MSNQPPQRFCTNCGQPLAAGAAFCVACGTPAGAPPTGSSTTLAAGAPPAYPPAYAQAQGQDDVLLAGLVAGSLANQMGSRPARRPRRPGARLRGCGCLLLILVLLAGPFIGVALTTGRLHQIFIYVAAGVVVLALLLILIGMLASRRGREALADAAGEGCLGFLEAILGGLFGGG
jgi:hypothetical protein